MSQRNPATPGAALPSRGLLPDLPRLALRSAILNPIDDERLDVYPRGLLLLERERARGAAAGYRVQAIDHAALFPKDLLDAVPVVDLEGVLLLPAFFDAHFHWVQDDVRRAPKENLLDWLSNHVFPHEARFADASLAAHKARAFARRLRAVGTLGGAIFGTLHPHTVDLALDGFTGDFIAGNPLMDVNAPHGLTHTSERALADVTLLALRHGPAYAVTPRFALSTTPALMCESAKIAHAAGAFIQSHLSEAAREIEAIVSMYRGLDGFGDVRNPTEIYERVGLLTDRSIMAHGVHLGDDELALLAANGTAIAHCPTSNAPISELGLGSGLFDFRRADAAGVRWALGSDIGAGPILSMFDVMRSFVRQNQRRLIREASFTRALCRATLGGADLLGLRRECGNLCPGKWANFIACPADFEITDAMSGEEILSRLIAPLDDDRARADALVQRAFFHGIEQPREELASGVDF